jgi:hypothetical protein
MTSLRLKRAAFALTGVILEYVSDLVVEPDIWEAGERVAEGLLKGPLSGRRIAPLCAARTQMVDCRQRSKGGQPG